MISVMIVDDDPAVRAALAVNLSDLGLAPSEATTGDEALTKAHLEFPDVILLDVHMPGMNGFEVLRKLRESPATRYTPVIMLTGLLSDEGEASAMALGGSGYITKPWNIDVLEASVRGAIREWVAPSDLAPALQSSS